MDCKVEKFIPSCAPEDGDTMTSYICNKPTIMMNKTSSQLDLLKKDSKPQHDKVSLHLSTNGSQLNITINGTTLGVTKTSCDISIGNFCIQLNSHCTRTPYPSSYIQPPSTVAVVSLSLGNPLHIISTGDTPYVTAALSLRKYMNNDKAQLN